MKKYIDTLMLSLILFCTLPVMPEYDVLGQNIQNTICDPYTSEHSVSVYHNVNDQSDNSRQNQDSKIEMYSSPIDDSGHPHH